MYCEKIESISLESPCLVDTEYDSIKNLSNNDIENLYYFVKMKMPPALLRNYDSEVKAVLEFAKNSNIIKIK